jgi:hypothetical protein
VTGYVELRGMDGFPHVQRHARAWCALGRARLCRERRPSHEYETRLVATMLRFLAGKRVPTRDEFGDVVAACLNDLCRVRYPNGVASRGEQVAAWEVARDWLKAADDFAAETLT